ncbi:response regulator [bacterium]|nr:response regulator [bacterium]
MKPESKHKHIATTPNKNFGSIGKKVYSIVGGMTMIIFIMVMSSSYLSQTISMVGVFTQMERGHSVALSDAKTAFYKYLVFKDKTFFDDYEKNITIAHSYSQTFGQIPEIIKHKSTDEAAETIANTFAEVDYNMGLVIVGRYKLLSWHPLYQKLIKIAFQADQITSEYKALINKYQNEENENRKITILNQMRQIEEEALTTLPRAFSNATADLSEFVSSFAKIIVWILFLILSVFCLVVSILMIQTIVNALTKLRNTIVAVEQSGDFSLTVAVDNEDEIGQIAKAFSSLLNTLGLQADQLKSQQKVLEHAVVAATASNKAKSEFLANMSHEIRTPMNAILGFAEILKSRESDPKKSRFINNIYANGSALLNIINDILDLSKVEAGKIELRYTALSIHSLLDELKVIFDRKISDKGLEFIIDIEEDIPQALVLDETRLRQLLINLIGNAVKFTETGHIRLSARVIVPEAEQGSQVDLFFDVEDTGMGIPKEAHERVFEAFEQSDVKKNAFFGGTGLGLAISKKLAEIMGGTISVESEINSGSVFRVELKDVEIAVGGKPEKENNALFNPDTIAFDPARILIVDDIDYNRELLTQYLKNWSFIIEEAVNGKEMLEKAHLSRPDLILLDMKMPIMDGYQAAEILKQDENLKDIPVIAITASALTTDEERIRGLCASYLRKPVSRSDLIKQLMKFITHSIENTTEIQHIERTNEPPEFPSLDDLKKLPEEWLAEFSRAVRHADKKTCEEAIRRLDPEFKTIAAILNNAISEYRFGELADMLEKSACK